MSAPTQTSAAPGRVNLIGEHTDYTGGLVLPMAIDFDTLATLEPIAEPIARISSRNFDEQVEFSLADLPQHGRRHWSDYPVGVLWAMRQQGIDVPGFSLTLDGHVPLGAGLSSSASVEVATAIALLRHAKIELPGEEIARLCRRAENEFVGAASGIMDQFVSVFGQAGHALLIDCRSLQYENLPLPSSVKVVICNSMVKHTVAHGEYGDRRGEVEAGQAVLLRERPGITSLRDATLADLEACRGKMSPASFLRCRHIITENERVERARAALRAEDFVAFGKLMLQAHASFRDDFAASCPEIDTLVEIASHLPGCFGARITGGGFGGCTVNLLAAEQAESFRTELVRRYREALGIDAESYISAASDGALARAR
jgi:galactokinase